MQKKSLFLLDRNYHFLVEDALFDVKAKRFSEMFMNKIASLEKISLDVDKILILLIFDCIEHEMQSEVELKKIISKIS